MQIIDGYLGGKLMAWIDGVEADANTILQASNAAMLPFVGPHVALMPDCHFGIGSTVGSVIPTKSAIIPAAVGVDIGCGMMAWRTSLKAVDLPDDIAGLRTMIEAAVPHGGLGPTSGWGGKVMPASISARWRNSGLEARFKLLVDKHPKLETENHLIHLGSLGGGNHFVELCLDEDQRVWVMLHSGSRGIGNAIGRTFIAKAKEALEKRHLTFTLPDKDLAWLEEGEQDFDDYVEAVGWGQDFARQNREAMMERVLLAMRVFFGDTKRFTLDKQAVNCHHNYVNKEHHFGADVWVTRKGAVSARAGELGIIPGSMGARSFIVEGLGNLDSFHTCSHGAGRRMSRGAAKRTFTLEDHIKATEGVECRKDADVIDETPGAYKDIDAVMAAQVDLVKPVAILKQFLCIKG